MVLTLSGCRAVTPAVSTGNWQVGVNNLEYSQEAVWENTFVGVEPYGLNYWANDNDEHQHIVVYDLNAREKLQSIDPPSGKIIEPPAIYGSEIVFAAMDKKDYFRQMLSSAILPSPNYDIYLYNLETNQMRQLTTEEHSQISPRIYGNAVVWLDSRNRTESHNSMDIYALDLKTNEETRITATPTASEMAFNGNTIVWTDDRYMDKAASFLGINDPKLNYDIFAYDLESKKEYRITTSKNCDRCPAIDGARITWLRQVTEYKADIYTYNLESRKETLISHDGCAESNPSIQNNRVVWIEQYLEKDAQSYQLVICGSAIVYYDLQTKTQTLLTPLERGEQRNNPVISGARIVYLRSNGGNYACVIELSK
jgi:beta propeller repeat protein